VLAASAPDLHPARNISGGSPSYSVWLGASVFASIKGNERSFVNVADVLAVGPGSTPSVKTFAPSTRAGAKAATSATEKSPAKPVGDADPQLYQFSAPDWMSASASAGDVFAFVLN